MNVEQLVECEMKFYTNISSLMQLPGVFKKKKTQRKGLLVLLYVLLPTHNKARTAEEIFMHFDTGEFVEESQF
jgi:hypothetical protein